MFTDFNEVDAKVSCVNGKFIDVATTHARERTHARACTFLLLRVWFYFVHATKWKATYFVVVCVVVVNRMCS